MFDQFGKTLNLSHLLCTFEKNTKEIKKQHTFFAASIWIWLVKHPKDIIKDHISTGDHLHAREHEGSKAA